MTKRQWTRVAATPGPASDRCRPAKHGLGLCRSLLLLSTVAGATPALAQPISCEAYARSYADAHVSGDPTDLHIVDQAMEGAVVGGAWRGPRGARRGAVAGGALGVLDTLGNDPAGWRGLYDLAYRLCRQSRSPATHRPDTLGDPSHRPMERYRPGLQPPAPARPPAPLEPDN